jgi:hypothetical protein
MEKSEAIRHFLAGFVCGEGCFTKSKLKEPRNSIAYSFALTQHKRDRSLLELLKKELGCGEIYFSKSRNTYDYRCQKQKDLVEKVIPYFDGYLKGYKKKQFERWRDELIPYYNSFHIRKSISASRGNLRRWERKKGFPTQNNLTLTLPK